VPAAPLVTLTPVAPLMAPDAVQPATVFTGFVASALWGWWQSAQAACRFTTPPNSSPRSDSWASDEGSVAGCE
jgi:hypothetical protein